MRLPTPRRGLSKSATGVIQIIKVCQESAIE